MSDLILRDDTGPIVRLVLNSPQNFNALSAEMIATLYTTLATVANEEGPRVIIIAAEGKAFSAGHDLRQMQAARANIDGGRAGFAALFEGCSQLMQLISTLPQPVIAEVQGIATAAGCQLVASCDLAVASEKARFGVNGIDVGLFCATPAVALSRAIPRKAAFELLVTGDFISAVEAQRLGLVNRVVAPDSLASETMSLARKIAQKLPSAIAMGKRGFYEQLAHDTADAYEAAGDTMVANMMLSDTNEGLNAFLEKRRPSWDATEPEAAE
ncbi:enoyl-CoA hydratase [Paracoccus aurantiacus]|uniref:Enoyl-CoA hydratase domain-containing protein 3, mitochondrial n=1 Tax=Paracoccus aurantiacus TaxID=2599412 RepID=A0A5C6RZW4_9RHOB|nr:enoyl-CoA hydratase [Paracoccus aurantiacus]TXB67535.1 enoyl-CoA hydratase [Paracoccus aurantiacus]